MHTTKLPNEYRPRGLKYRRLEPGLHLPTWFIDGIKSIDDHLHFVWHPYKTMYDDVMNADYGSLEDPRWTIHEEFSQEIWGHVLYNRDSSPARDEAWHIWRLARPYGWAHVTRIDQTSSAFLRFCLDRLCLADQVAAKYGHRAWNAYQREEQELARQHKIADLNGLMMDTTKENKWLLRQAMESFERKMVNATNPQKETISSYAGQKNHTRLSRDLTDKEGGLVVPEQFSRGE